VEKLAAKFVIGVTRDPERYIHPRPKTQEKTQTFVSCLTVDFLLISYSLSAYVIYD